MAGVFGGRFWYGGPAFRFRAARGSRRCCGRWCSRCPGSGPWPGGGRAGRAGLRRGARPRSRPGAAGGRRGSSGWQGPTVAGRRGQRARLLGVDQGVQGSGAVGGLGGQPPGGRCRSAAAGRRRRGPGPRRWVVAGAGQVGAVGGGAQRQPGQRPGVAPVVGVVDRGEALGGGGERLFRVAGPQLQLGGGRVVPPGRTAVARGRRVGTGRSPPARLRSRRARWPAARRRAAHRAPGSRTGGPRRAVCSTSAASVVRPHAMRVRQARHSSQRTIIGAAVAADLLVAAVAGLQHPPVVPGRIQGIRQAVERHHRPVPGTWMLAEPQGAACQCHCVGASGQPGHPCLDLSDDGCRLGARDLVRGDGGGRDCSRGPAATADDHLEAPRLARRRHGRDSAGIPGPAPPRRPPGREPPLAGRLSTATSTDEPAAGQRATVRWRGPPARSRPGRGCRPRTDRRPVFGPGQPGQQVDPVETGLLPGVADVIPGREHPLVTAGCLGDTADLLGCLGGTQIPAQRGPGMTSLMMVGGDLRHRSQADRPAAGDPFLQHAGPSTRRATARARPAAADRRPPRRAARAGRRTRPDRSPGPADDGRRLRAARPAATPRPSPAGPTPPRPRRARPGARGRDHREHLTARVPAAVPADRASSTSRKTAGNADGSGTTRA